MLSPKILTRQDIGRAASYYEDSADDYYAKEGEASEWQGKGAKALKLEGSVDSLRFRQLLAGEVRSGESTRGSIRQDCEQRIGIDFSFSAPKSVSIQSLIGGDGAIIKAHDKAVQRAVDAAEVRAQTRKKIQGKSRVETTGNLIVAKFRHETSREQDPQLHTHAVILNLTQRSDRQWRALKNDEILKMTKYLGAVYRSELAAELQKLGYQLRHERDGLFELAHISREQLEGFSARSNQIETKLAEQGLTRETATYNQKQQATMQTRARKVSSEREAIFQIWQAKAHELNINFNSREWAGASGKNLETHTKSLHEYTTLEAAKHAVKFAVNHLTERQSIMDERTLLDTAIKHAVGNARLADIQQEIKERVEKGFLIQEAPLYLPEDEINSQNQGKTKQMWVSELIENGMDKTDARKRVDTAIIQGGLVRLEHRYTTQMALEREKSILKIEYLGRNVLSPLLSLEAAQKKLASLKLTPGQREAVELMTTTKHRIVGIQGFAGTGKSHMLKTAKAMVEEQGFHMRALAPYGGQVKALRELGVKSNTLASFLRAKDKNMDERTVLVIDEAGVVPTRLMEQSLRLAEKTGARVILMGDIAQTKAIEAGRPFHQLQTAGMCTTYMREIQRQKQHTSLKDAVELAAKGKTEASLQRISSISEIEDDSKRHRMIVNDYMNLSAQDRDRTIIVAGTNDARREMNKMVREHSGVAGRGIEFDTLIRRDTTQVERKFSKHYRMGDVIQPEKDYHKIGLKRGALYKVRDTGPGNRLTVFSESGERFEFNPMVCQKISVYQPERAELAKGDVVRITRNDARLDVANGDRMKVESVTEKAIVLSDGKCRLTLQTDKPLHLDYAYATTVHSSQGLTSDRVFIDMRTNDLTTGKDVYYVAISRAKKEARIYTNNIKELPQAIARENLKHAAFDLARETQKIREKDRIHEKKTKIDLNLTKSNDEKILQKQ